MNYKKIILTPKSWLITPLESDTVLSYVFAYNFDKLKNIFDKFLDWNPSFVLSNWFIEGILPKPIFFNTNLKLPETDIKQDIDQEKERKKIKKLSTFPLDKIYFEMLFEWDNYDEYNEKIKWYLDNFMIKQEIVSDYKNSIKRFNLWETEPYEIENIKYISWNYVIYIKVYDENDFKIFFDSMKNTFETIWFWKAKSRWYGSFKEVNISDLSLKEKEVFDYFEELKQKYNLYFVLNNFKPNDDEINNFDLSKSYYQINNKHTKSLYEFNKEIFKWQMNFIEAWSVIYSENNLKWDFYKNWNSYNFWFIF